MTKIENATSRVLMHGFVPQPSLNVEAIQQEVAAGYINEQLHPSAPLRILNYSQRAQFDWRWNAATMHSC